jgi:hypothetical protein
MNRLTFYGFALSAAVLLGNLPPLAAHRHDEQAAREEVARQALEQQIADLLKKADKLKDKPSEALPLLEQAQKLLKETNVSLGLSRRTELEDTIVAKIKAAKNPPVKPAAPLPPDTSDKPKGTDAATGNLTRGSQTMGDRAREQEKLRDAKRQGRLSAMNQIDEAAGNIPKNGDPISYPKNWDKIKQRDKILASGLAQEDKALLRLLDEIVKEPVQFKDTSLDEVLKYLQNNLGLSPQISKATLDEVQLDYSKPITVNIPKGATKRVILMRILSDLDLAYVIKNGMLVVMTAQRASKEMVTVPYYIGDLRGMTGEQVANMIQNQIEPTSWRKAGGPGSIIVEKNTLWITNTTEVIGRITGYRK